MYQNFMNLLHTYVYRLYFTTPPQKKSYNLPIKKYFNFAPSLIIKLLDYIQFWYRFSRTQPSSEELEVDVHIGKNVRKN